MPGLKGLVGGIFFVTKFYFTESQSFVEYSPKYTYLSCLWHKTWDESDAFV